MRRLITPLLALGIIATACGGAAVTAGTVETVPAPPATVSTTEAPVTTDLPDPSTTTTQAPPVTSAPIVVDGPPAPDFALALDDGRGFILSDEEKPVYMVFWAEW